MRRIPMIALGLALGVALTAGLGAAYAAFSAPDRAWMRHEGAHAGMLANVSGRAQGMPGPMRHICGEGHGGRIDTMITLVDSFVAFTPEQRIAWDDLVGAVRAGTTHLAQACPDEDAAATSPAMLARFETMLTAGLEAVGTIRPAYEAFYGTLDEAQRKAIDDIASHRRGRH